MEMSSVTDPLILACVRPSPDQSSQAVAVLSKIVCGQVKDGEGGSGGLSRDGVETEGEVRGEAKVNVFDHVFGLKAGDKLFEQCFEPMLRGE